MAQLYFYYSSMNAGKSTNLLQSAHNYEERGMKTLVLTPSIDTRYKVGLVKSRIGLEREAQIINPTDNLQLLDLTDVRCILVDEAQFMSAQQIEQLAHIADNEDIPVLCFGLRTDFQSKAFEGSLRLLELADKLVELKTVCHCGKKAGFVLRTDEKGNVIRDGAQIEVGGNDKYVSVCRKHFFRGQTMDVKDMAMMSLKRIRPSGS